MDNFPAQRHFPAWLYLPDQPGLLRLTGRDQLAFIQRQTTNNIDLLSEDKGQVNVLTTSLARILDVFFVFKDPQPGEPGLNIVTLPGRAQATLRFLKSRIFFNDQVNLENASSGNCQLWLDGAQASNVLQKVGVNDPPPIDGIRRIKLDGHEVVLAGRRGLNSLGYLIVAPEPTAKEIENSLVQNGAAVLTHDEYKTMRIEFGQPGAQNELIEAYTPYEVGLGYAVSQKKGCYTGQEVLARQVTYDKITRQMTGVRLEAEVQPGNAVLADGKPAGEITSAAVSPIFGPIALAVLKRPFFEPGTPVQVKAGEATIPATTCQLPFNQVDTHIT